MVHVIDPALMRDGLENELFSHLKELPGQGTHSSLQCQYRSPDANSQQSTLHATRSYRKWDRKQEHTKKNVPIAAKKAIPRAYQSAIFGILDSTGAQMQRTEQWNEAVAERAVLQHYLGKSCGFSPTSRGYAILEKKALQKLSTA